MAIKFQYNKTALQSLNKQLKVRLKALPTLKNKESALRLEVKKAKDQRNALRKQLEQKIRAHANSAGLWHEYLPDLLTISKVKTHEQKIAGVAVPILKEVQFSEKDYSLFKNPQWFPEGTALLKELAQMVCEEEIMLRKTALLDHARRKTTQKVNLYEKVQIPGYEDAIRKIKRFLEDEENLSKSAQKIVKKRQQQTKEAEV